MGWFNRLFCRCKKPQAQYEGKIVGAGITDDGYTVIIKVEKGNLYELGRVCAVGKEPPLVGFNTQEQSST